MTMPKYIQDPALLAQLNAKADPFESALAAEGATGPVAEIARSIYQQESSSGKNTKTSNAGAVGGMQIIPPTFKSVAEKDWSIDDPEQNARAGIRYVKQLYDQAGGDPALTAAGYYGGPGGLEKARRGVAVSDPRNPGAPTTLQYGQQVASRIPKEKGMIQRGVEAMIPSAQAAERKYIDDPELLKQLNGTVEVPAVATAPEPSMMDNIKQGTGNLVAGAVRGAGSIGATLLAPIDMAKDAMAGKGLSLESNRQRRADMDAGLQTMGAEPDSFMYKAGKLGGEIAGTAGASGLLAKGATAAAPGLAASPMGARVLQSIASGGFTSGAPAVTNVAGKALDLGLRAAGGAITGGASAGLVNPEDAGAGAVIGGATPIVAKALGSAGRAIGRGIAGKPMTQEVKQLAVRAKELGIDIPADRLVNSKPLNAVASSLDYVPMSGRAGTMDKMQSQLNKALSKTFGQDSDNVTMALRKAQSDLGSKFDQVLKSNTVKVDQAFMDDLAEAANRASRELGSDGAGIIGKQVDDILAKATTGEIDGQAAYNIKRTLDRISNRTTPEAFYARDLKKGLMSALDRSLGPDEAKAFAEVRKQYGNMLSLENLAQNGAEGNISIARLANMKNINNPELQELADISAQFLKPRESAHGAMQRVVLGTGGAVASGMGAAPAVGAGIAAGRGANMMLNSSVARNALMGQPQTNSLLKFAGEPELAQMFYRAAPVVGTSGR